MSLAGYAGIHGHAVTIQTASDGQDARGGPTLTYSTFSAWSAVIQPLTGKELVEAQQRHATVTHRMYGTWVSGVTPKHRVLWWTRTFRIEAAVNVGELDRQLQIDATEEV